MPNLKKVILFGPCINGLHSNGFSLIRKVIKELDLKYEENCPFLETKTSAKR